MSGNDRSASEAPLQSAAWVEDGAPAGDVFVGDARLVQGGAKVSISQEAPAAAEESGDRRPALSNAEIEESGLLRDRVIEIGEMREEAVVSKQAFVREELVVRRNVEERTERIADTLRRTEVDVERLEPEPVADGAGEEDLPGR